MKKRVCDVCGKDMPFDETYTLVRMKKILCNGKQQRSYIGAVYKDMCKDCLDSVTAMLTGSDDEIQAESLGGCKPRYDHKKILSLRDAGWTYADIADEMGCSEQTVKKVVLNAKKKAVLDD